jgi:hypothetical protein
MARKRARGAGRKPRGEFRGKTAMLTHRITPTTRAALERAAAKNDRSLSQEVESRLDHSIRRDRNSGRGLHIRALGEAVMLTAQCIERATEKHWNEDAFTGEALRRAVEFLITHFAPRGTPALPASIKAAAAKRPDRTGDAYPSSAGVGVTEAGQVISWIESWNFRTIDEVERINRSIVGAHFPDEWYAHEQLFRELGSGWKRAQSKEKH